MNTIRMQITTMGIILNKMPMLVKVKTNIMNTDKNKLKKIIVTNMIKVIKLKMHMIHLPLALQILIMLMIHLCQILNMLNQRLDNQKQSYRQQLKILVLDCLNMQVRPLQLNQTQMVKILIQALVMIKMLSQMQ